MTFVDAFDRTVRVHGGDPAVVTADGNTFTYDAFDQRATQLASTLTAHLGDAPIAVLARNSPIAVESMVASHRRGTPTVQLPFRGTPETLVEMAETVGARGLVFDDANAESALTMLDRGSFDLAIHAGETSIDHPAVETAAAVRDESGADLPDDPDGDTNVFFTSGTTSQPKAVAFDGEAMWIGAYQGVMEHGIDQTDVAIVATPWYHMVTTDAWLYPHWLAGATTVLLPAFEPEAVLASIETHGATGLLAVPTQLDALCSAQSDGSYDLTSLAYVRTGGAVVSETLVERTTEHLCEALYNTYGLTEGGPNLTFAHPTVQDEHPGTIGKASFAWELRVVESVPLDEQPDPDATVGPGERGEIIGRGPAVPEGYIDNPAAEDRSFFGEWLRTRDVARVDADGFLYVIDRVDNMFTSGGENVYPAEVERVLAEHSHVDEALVVGLPDDRWGNRVAAVVVTEGAVDADDLNAFCRDHHRLPDFKRPREYAFRAEPLPRTDTGTVERERVVDVHFG